ncbi:MAG TPA: metallophosphoesterase family protein [Candidatus Hydrogenedens sp.]|nr:metallophosphoesterase family protein [Candidatus Hydrogenedens sp.]HOL21053.1 metallophosphoesterase family protein [Candidatus Hydrogenedens sp.]HPP58694.1 metallophosphoesterase family protein [Candidatus Hydrogenedens sp.]
MFHRILGIISDTHNNYQLAEKVCFILINEKKVSTIYHLGDNYEDGEYLSSLGLPIKMVPGLWCDQFHDWKTPKIIKEEILNIKIAFAHTLELLQKSDARDSHILCFGHTHTPIIKIEEDKVLFNPGHLKKNIDLGKEASFGIIELTQESAIFEIISAIDVKKILNKAQVSYNNILKNN